MEWRLSGRIPLALDDDPVPGPVLRGGRFISVNRACNVKPATLFHRRRRQPCADKSITCFVYTGRFDRVRPESDAKNLNGACPSWKSKNKALGDKIWQLRTDWCQAALENGLRDMYANQGAEFYAFKEDVRQLNGRFDEMEYRINKEMRNVAASIENTADTVGIFSKTAAENKDRISRL
ncbi:MAG: hypothetical protein R2860_07630 [Desulfobacterales bacterium]